MASGIDPVPGGPLAAGKKPNGESAGVRSSKWHGKCRVISHFVGHPILAMPRGMLIWVGSRGGLRRQLD